MQEWTRTSIVEASGSYWCACAIHAAIELDIFTLLGERRLGIQEVAAGLQADTRGVGLLLHALAALGLLEKDPSGFAASPFSRTHLDRNAPDYLGYIIMHHHHLMGSWQQLAGSVRDGVPARRPDLFNDPQQLESFLMGMFNLASTLAPHVVSEVDLAGRRRLLDLGGGPGTYAIHFCLNNPGLEATVFDLPGTRSFAERTIARYELSDRVQFQSGDFHQDTLRGSYDAVWLSHILHSDTEDICRALLRKAVSVLEPGGLILVHDFILDDTLDGPTYPALFSLNMFLNTPGGRSYSGREIMDMLAAAGVDELRRIPVPGGNETGIIAGVNAGA